MAETRLRRSRQNRMLGGVIGGVAEYFDRDPTLLRVASKVGRSAAQVLLRWGIQKGVVVLPKSVSPARIAENAALFDFELDAAAMQALDGLEANLTTGWDPAGQR